MEDIMTDVHRNNERSPKRKLEMDNNSHDNSGDTDDPPKKRRRTAKPNAEKKFECKHEGCGKSYSRAEHLYRHQLNHTPKTIYRCDYPDCNRYFVRQDLCVRHRERHTTHGSQLHKRDSFAQASANQIASRSNLNDTHGDGADMISPPQNAAPNHPIDSHDEIGAVQAAVHHRSRLSVSNSSNAVNDNGYQVINQHNGFTRPPMPLHRESSSFTANPYSPENRHNNGMWHSSSRRDSMISNDGRHNSIYSIGDVHQNNTGQVMPPSPSRAYSDSPASTHQMHGLRRSDSMMNGSRSHSYIHQPVVSNNMFGANDYHRTHDVTQAPNDAFSTAVSQGLNNIPTDFYGYGNMTNTMGHLDPNAGFVYPIFGGDNYNTSPMAIGEDFTAWLFDAGTNGPTGQSPNILMPYGDNPISHYQQPFLAQSPTTLNQSNSLSMTSPIHLNKLMDPSVNTNFLMSEEKRQELLHIMQTMFVERPYDAIKKSKEKIFEGDPDNDEQHILSLTMMQTYISSYWYHQHAQLPILHKPTFAADKEKDLLLLAIISIGAATLDKSFGTELTNDAAEFANFVSWHVRWEIIRVAEARPPAKLWVFQTLLLVEVYEKMYSTRVMHERAHIHHDTTLTLMRRGSSLTGQSAVDTPPSRSDAEAHRQTETDHTYETTSKTKESWIRWIAAEATRRVAFAAFVLDSIHCTMFGHSAKMGAHEMHLPLPCDEGLWSATSLAEVQRVQSSLSINGVRPIAFLDALKKTLIGQRVRTNTFGRTIIMSGLLSVSWHMRQRDLQMSPLGRTSVNGRDNWKALLLKAFDYWKRDFDEALAESFPTPTSPARLNPSSLPNPRSSDEESVFESRTVLHHLAHIAAHVDIVDCQIFAGATRLLSRNISVKDYSAIREKIEKWATKASARDSAFYALKFIAGVLTPPDQADQDTDSIDKHVYSHPTSILPLAFENNQYMARDDFLLNRPWILYISALVVWCYGFALEGPIVPSPRDEDFATYEQQEKDMRRFLERVASVNTADELEHIRGKNRCLGLLLVLKDTFRQTRWELTHEAAILINKAIMKLKGPR